MMDSGPITGLVFRHHMINGRDMDVIKALTQMIVRERANGEIRMVLFSDLLKAARIKDDQ
ncbi:MAG: hypothetical protein JNN05_02785 [Candidatus Omnitrophica bacterium]|nr:hypothetical protein [Candidatus Omnitrophota bacterium]